MANRTLFCSSVKSDGCPCCWRIFSVSFLQIAPSTNFVAHPPSFAVLLSTLLDFYSESTRRLWLGGFVGQPWQELAFSPWILEPLDSTRIFVWGEWVPSSVSS